MSKIYVSDVSGDALIDTGETLEDLGKRAVYTAQGTVIETKRPRSTEDSTQYFSTLVYSNGTGAYFDADTRVELRTFVQEPFTPNRSDMEVEPSLSQTQAFVSRGVVGLCTSKLVAGSVMNYQTPLASVNIRGRKVVIESQPNVTRISMLEGESTVRAGALDLGGHILQSGEQAIITRGAPGEPNQLQIAKIPDREMAQLDDKVAMACMAKRTVYFEVRESATEGGTSESASGAITAFDSTGSATIRDLVPLPVIPLSLPTEFAVSPATIPPPGS